MSDNISPRTPSPPTGETEPPMAPKKPKRRRTVENMVASFGDVPKRLEF